MSPAPRHRRSVCRRSIPLRIAWRSPSSIGAAGAAHPVSDPGVAARSCILALARTHAYATVRESSSSALARGVFTDACSAHRPGVPRSRSFAWSRASPHVARRRRRVLFGAFPTRNSVQAPVKHPSGAIERFGSVVTATPMSRFHSLSISHPAVVYRFLDSAFADGALVSNGHQAGVERV